MDDPNTIKAAAAFVILTLVIALGAWRVANLRREARGLDDAEADDLLADLKAGFEAGHMSEAEYQRIRESLERQGALPSDRWAIPPRSKRDEPPPPRLDEPF